MDPKEATEKLPEGWVCPTCKRVISPLKNHCPFCDVTKSAEVHKVAGGKETKNGMIKESRYDG